MSELKCTVAVTAYLKIIVASISSVAFVGTGQFEFVDLTRFDYASELH